RWRRVPCLPLRLTHLPCPFARRRFLLRVALAALGTFGTFGAFGGVGRVGRPEHGAAALREAAAAGEYLVYARRIVLFALYLIVVGHLLARRDRARGLDEHPPLLDHRLAVGVAGVIEEAGIVAVDAGIDDGSRIDDEEEGMGV